MATITFTFTANQETGSALRRMADQVNRCASGVPDRVSTGADSVVTFNNSVTGAANGSVQISSGPYAGSAYLF